MKELLEALERDDFKDWLINEEIYHGFEVVKAQNPPNKEK